MNALELNNVVKLQGSFVLDHVSLALPQGCIMGLIGENGAGKTTMIRLLLGLSRADEGQVSLLGVNSRDGAFTRVRDQVGVVLDEACFPQVFHLKQVDKTFSGVYGGWQSDTFFALCKRFALDEGKAFKDYSRGMKMKLAIATALSHRAKLLVLDEPTSGLDPIVRDEILDLMMEFTREEGNALLLSSHIVTDIEKLSDYVAFLHEGKLKFCEEKDALEEKYALAVVAPEDYRRLDKQMVVGAREGKYQVEALVRRDRAPRELPLEKASIEDIMLLMTRGNQQ